MEKYTVTGMSCASCSSRVEKAVSKVPGVEACSVNLLTNSMTVGGSASSNEIIAAVQKAGYGASLKKSDETKESKTSSLDGVLEDRETPALKRRLAVSVILLLILMYFSMGHMMWNFPLPPFLSGNHTAMGILQLLLSAAVMIVNQSFFINGFKSLFHFAPNMDTLVALGSLASFGYSIFVLFAMTDAQMRGDGDAVMAYMHEFYFESAAMILTLITVGKMLEARSKGKTTDALKGLMKLSPKTAVVLKEGKEVTVPTEEIRKGDVFVVRPGESIPADGIVLEGYGAVDESALTGESIPADKFPGDTVSAATINQSGFLKCEAKNVGEDTALSQIIQMVSDAASTKAPIAKIADKVSGVFVPIVMGIAALTIIVWLIVGQTFGFAIARGISVLVISCPCALGLATPVAIMVGSGVGAKNGILFKTAACLEEAGKVKVVALDKTGTVTKGLPMVTDIIPTGGVGESELLTIACSLEEKSEHPLARAVLQEKELRGIESYDVSDFRALPGNGLTAVMNGSVLCGGSFSFISSQTTVPDEVKTESERLAEQGKTPLLFTRDGILSGVIAVADVIKEESPQAIKEMREMGMHVVMLTGDNKRTADAIGSLAGVDEVIADVRPDGKESVIRELKEKYGKAAMVGDGINDAPALTRADIGIAIGAGTDIAIDAADIVLMKSRLTDVPAAVRLSRATLKNIRENLFWAFIYNIIGIPLAAGVFISMLGWQLNPMFGAAAMSLSSFCVVTNALRLNFAKIYKSHADDKPLNKNGEYDTEERVQISDSKFEKGRKTIMEKTLKIEGMMCSHCEARVKKALESLENVSKAEVSHEKGTAVVIMASEIEDDILKKAVEDQDYKVISVKMV